MVIVVLAHDLIIFEKLSRSSHQVGILLRLVLYLAHQQHTAKQHISIESKISYPYVFTTKILCGDLISYSKIIRSQAKTSIYNP